jgi:hypothetical protein
MELTTQSSISSGPHRRSVWARTASNASRRFDFRWLVDGLPIAMVGVIGRLSNSGLAWGPET